MGNYFTTEEQAQLSRDRMIAKQELKDRCHIPTEKDWRMLGVKYFMYYDIDFNKVKIGFYTLIKGQGTIFTLNKQDLEDYIAEKGKEFVKKYILDIDE